MSTRERWIVYPLLFLALGVALRDKMLPRTRPLRAATIEADRLVVRDVLVAPKVDALSVECRAVTVVSPGGGRAGILTSDQGSGVFQLYGSDHNLVVAASTDDSGKQGRLGVLADGGKLQVELLTTPRGGLVKTADRDGRLLITLGHLEASSGVAAMRPGGDPVPLTLRVPPRPAK